MITAQEVVTMVNSDRARDAARHAAIVNELRREQAAIGWEPATVINLNPYPVFALVNYFGSGRLTCPAATKDGPGKLVIRDYAVDLRDSNGEYVAKPVQPIQIANEFLNQNRHIGGVLVVRGKSKPTAEQVNAAEERRQRHMRFLVQEASAYYNRTHDIRNVNSLAKMAAHELHAKGELAVLPEWCNDVANAIVTHRPCPQCAEQIRVEARKCRYCGSMVARLRDSRPKQPAEEAAAGAIASVEKIMDQMGQFDPGPVAAPAEEDDEDTVDL